MAITGGGLPFTAWQQAVFVVLFIVLIGFLLRWFSGQQKNWQDFISQRDAQWQMWMASNEAKTCAQLQRMTETLDRLAEKLDAHDEKVEERVTRASSVGRKTQPRKPPQ